MKSSLAESIITIFKKSQQCVRYSFFFNIFIKKCRNELCNPKTMEQSFKITDDKKITGLNTSFHFKPAMFTLANKTSDFLLC